MLFKPDFAFFRITDIEISFLRNNELNGLILDIDNTLTTHDNPVPAEGVTEWIENMKQNDIKLIIVSNNHPPRVKPFADLLGIDFVCEGKKPLSKGFRQATEKLKLPFNKIGAVGDQIYTDILGANLFGIKSLYVSPIEYEKTRFFRFKRKMEIPFIPKKLYRKTERNF
ncbi:MAG TPA: YqeG family HAD IIIA-type phosphatase [Ruminococcus sp.]|nr:YqeG family HAD IIIA-type phosphatase [Ruminococcus sp.]